MRAHVVAAAFASTALALTSASPAKAEGWSGNVQVTSVAPSDDSDAQGQGVWVTVSASPTTPCSNSTFRLWSRSAAGRAENIRLMFSTLTAARLSSRPVHIYVGPCSPQGNPYIYGVALL